MRILSVDPGYTTGIAIVDEDGEWESAFSVTRRGLYRNGFLNHLVAISQPDVVLIEELPASLVSSEMRQIHAYIANWFRVAGYEIENIKPAQWKGLATRIEIPGTHTRDAATMASWWVRQNQRRQET